MRSRRLKALLALTLLIGSGTGAAALAATAGPPRARLGDYFSTSDIERSRRYRTPAYLLSFGGLAVALAVGAAIGLGPGVRRLGRWASQLTGDRWPLEALLLAAVVTLAVFLASLPFSWGRYLHDRHWGLSTQSA